jgi:RNA polymerase sigma-70 factor (ECF subfamily)
MRLESGEFTLHRYLIQKSQEGDRKAQHELYNLYVAAMYNICRRMMGNDEDAKDVLQEAFIQAFSKLGTLQKVDSFPGWLKRIVINKCLNALNQTKEFPMLSHSDPPSLPEAQDTLEVSEHRVSRIKKAIDHISEGCRTVLNLYVFEGYSHQEIAEILSISESASKSQYSKAKSKIRELIEQNLV